MRLGKGMKPLKSKNRILMALFLCAVLIFTTGGSAVRAAAGADSQAESAASAFGQAPGISLETTGGGSETASLELADTTAASAASTTQTEMAAQTTTAFEKATQTQSTSSAASTVTQTTAARATAPSLSLMATAATGIQIQYDDETTIHSVGDGDDTLILYCMNNALHWPHSTASTPSVPAYRQTTIADFLSANGVTDSSKISTLESELKALLYAGYPYNGLGLYQVVDSVPDITEDEFNELLTPPQFLRDDFPDSLGTTVFTLSDATASDQTNINLLRKFLQGALDYRNGRTTASGLTYQQITATPFWKAAYCLTAYGSRAPQAYTSWYVSGYYVTAAQAYSATSNAVWHLLYSAGLSNNREVDTSGLVDRLLSESSDYTLLESEPSGDNVSLTGDLSFYYNAEDGRWHTYPIMLSVPDNYNTYFKLVLPDGVQEENQQAEIKKGGGFSLVADDPAAFTQVQLIAEIPWIVGDLKVYEPEAGVTASDGKGFQNMIGAVIRTTKVSRTFQIVKKTSVSVTKEWNDNNNQYGKQPESVQVQLYADGTKSDAPVTLNADNNWTYTWEKLPVSENGQNSISYTVKELNTPDGYTASVTGDAESGYVITNSYTPETEAPTTQAPTTEIPTTQEVTTSTTEVPTTQTSMAPTDKTSVAETEKTSATQAPIMPTAQTTTAQTQTTSKTGNLTTSSSGSSDAAVTTSPMVPGTTTEVPSNPASETSAGTDNTSASAVSEAAEVIDPSQISTSGSAAAQNTVPSTGDHSHMSLFGLIMAVCAGAIAVNLVLRRKNREQR